MPAITNLVPISPNAASLAKFGEVPVGYYTGIPNISVPLYEVNSGSLKLPVSLGYHAGGVKVEEVASWAGLGWSLNAGGVISRQVRGLADESTNGYLSTHGQITTFINSGMTSTQQQTYLDNIADGDMDSQPDMFTYNIGGESGKFVFDTAGNVVTIPNTRNKFEFGTFLGQSNSWKITDISGAQYYFTAKETTGTIPILNNTFPTTTPPDAVSSWYLTRIFNPQHTDSIALVYDATTTNFNTIASQTKYVNGICGAKATDHSYSQITISGQRLTRIDFRNGSVIFNRAPGQRCDYVLDYALSSIIIENTDSSFYKKYQLYQSFVSTSAITCGTTDPELIRMYLDSVSIYDKTSRIGRYAFDYQHRDSLTGRRAYSQDHWGFYNGADNSSDFVPTTNIPSNYIDSAYSIFAGADRNPDSAHALFGTLQSITYPTGGKTVFEFENNRINNLAPDEDFVVGYGEFHLVGNPGGLPSYDTTFTISDEFANTGGVTATISLSAAAQCDPLALGCVYTTIYGPGGGGGSYISANGLGYMRKGTYRITVSLPSGFNPEDYILTITWAKGGLADSTLRHNMLAGGLRVKKITNYPSDSAIAEIKRYTYNTPGVQHYSGGVLLSFPKYVGSLTYSNSGCQYSVISSGSNYPMATTQDSHVGYRYVQELLGENGEFGKNEYEFTAPDSFPDRLMNYFPYAPSTSFDWKRGQLLHSKNYRYDPAGNSYQLIQEKSNGYANNSTNNYQGLKTGQNVFYNGGGIPPPRTYEVIQYSTESGWFPLTGDTVTVYDQNDPSRFVQIVTSYTYGSAHYQPLSVTTKNSKGEVVIAKMKYPLDYSGLSGSDALTAGIKNLQDKNVVAPVIEKYTVVQNADASNTRVTNATLTAYKATIPLPDTIYTTELGATTASFSPTSVSGGSITKSTLYQPQLSLNKYDAFNNIIEQQKLKDAKHAYIWDYKATYPIAEVSNSDSTSIAYTSFEAEGTGNWSGISSGSVVSNASSPTGGKYYTLTGSTIQKTGLSSGATYIVSYWSSTGTYYTVSGTVSSSKTGASIGGWTYCEHEVTGATTISVSGTGSIDELRLYPKGSLMTTYTYQPLTGMTSQCDAGNKVTYYEYDTLGRLLQVKDEKRKVLKTFNYQYQ